MALRVCGRVRDRLRLFSNDTSGAIAAFTAVTFLTMFLAVGMAIDYMRHEAARAELQDALDRGVLAAALSPDQATAKTVVAQYLRFANFASDATEVDVTPVFVNAKRRVKASAVYPIRTSFLKLVGIPSLNVAAVSQAATTQSNIEVSLALDISGSMAMYHSPINVSSLADLGENFDASKVKNGYIKRLDLLKFAAKDFIDLMLEDGSTSTTINLIPFAGQVNAGPYVMDKLVANRLHDYSSCIDAAPSDLLDGDLFDLTSARQTPHFQYHAISLFGDDGEWGWCPSDRQAVEYMSNNASRLKNKIEGFAAHDGTGIPIAMAWALGLVDHNAQPLIADLADQGVVSEEFSDRPRPMDDHDVLKVIVLMSDGQVTMQPRPAPSQYDEPHEIEHLANYNLAPRAQMFTSADGSTYLADLCNAAKDQNVMIFTIGFGIAGGQAKTDLQNCASGASNYFDVDGIDLKHAFEAVATTVSKLRLTQ